MRAAPALAFLSAFALALQAPCAMPMDGGTGLQPRQADVFAFPDSAAARAAWKPMWSGGEPSVRTEGGESFLEMPCRFAGAPGERASWDLSAPLDLRGAHCVRFGLWCDDPDPIANFTLYFASGGGWYSGGFGLPSGKGWRPVEINLIHTGLEGAPSGFGAIRAVRLSAWKGQDRDTVFRVKRFETVRSGAPAAIVRAESALIAKSGESRAILECSALTAGAFRLLGLPLGVLSDLDLAAAPPEGTKLLVFPLNPDMPEDAAKQVVRFLGRGGRVMCFYSFPPAVAGAIGVKIGPWVGQKRPGGFARMRMVPGALPGAPAEVGQRSWNIREAEPVEGRSRAAAVWLDDRGEPAGHAAIVLSDNAAVMTHVLLQDDWKNKLRLLLAMAGSLVPEMWEASAESALAGLGGFGPFRGFDEAVKSMREDFAGSAEGAAMLDKAAALRAEARRLLSGRRTAEALDAASEAGRILVDAFCSSRKPLPGEHRAFWCHEARGVEGRTWDETALALAQNGFTAVIPNMLWAGCAAYPSEVLPSDARPGFDPLAECVAACRKHGLACHVWKVNWNMGGKAPREFADRMKREGRTQVRADGNPQDQWLCPSHPANQELEIASMIETARKYAVDGLHFDYIRFPDQSCCFCAGCRERFEKTLGRPVEDWPRGLARDAQARAAWLGFRRTCIDRVVEAVSREAREIRPGIRISAAVFPDWPTDRDRIGQDWKLWCDKGWLDFVCPMDYTADSGSFESRVRLQKEWAGKVPCYPGIGLSTWPDHADICRLIEQIGIARSLGTRGFTVFNLGAVESAEVLPRLGKGMTKISK